MTRTLSGLVWVLLLAAGCHRPHGSHPPASGPDVVIRGETLIIDGVPMRFGAPLAEWKRVLGEPARWLDRAGGVEVWDDSGLFVVMQAAFPKNDPHVAAVWFAMAPREGDIWPARPFAGRLEVDGRVLQRSTPARELARHWDFPTKVYEHPRWEGCSYDVGYRTTRGDQPTLEAVFVSSECPDAAHALGRADAGM